MHLSFTLDSSTRFDLKVSRVICGGEPVGRSRTTIVLLSVSSVPFSSFVSLQQLVSGAAFFYGGN
jgi:hypothetical protein